MPAKKGKPFGKRKSDNLPLPQTGELLPPVFEATQKRARLARPKAGHSKARQAEIIIASLLGGRTLKQAGEAANVSLRTVQVYLASPWFQQEFAAAKKNLLDETIANLRGFATGAVQGLNEILADRTVAPLARVSAGREILSAMLRAVELEDVVGQLEELKRAVAESKGGQLPVSNVRNIRRQVADLRAKVFAGSIRLTMPDGGEVVFPAKSDTVPRLVLRAFERVGSTTNFRGEPCELRPAPRLDEASALILQAESISWPGPEDENVPALLRDLLAKEAGVPGASDSQPEAGGEPGA